MDSDTFKVLITSGGPLGVLVFLVIVFLVFIICRDKRQEDLHREYQNRLGKFEETITRFEKSLEEVVKRLETVEQATLKVIEKLYK